MRNSKNGLVKIRGDGVFRKVDKVIKLLKKYKIYTEISTTINKKNIKYCHQLIQYTHNLDLPCNFNLFKPFSHKHFSLIVTPEEYFNFILKIFELRKKQKIKIGLTNAAIISYLANKEARDECRATVVGLTVDVDGRMVPCPFLKLSHYYDVKKLPLLDKNFIRTWNKNKYFKNFRKRGLKECQACSYIFTNDINANNPYGIYAFKKFLRFKSKNDFVKKH